MKRIHLFILTIILLTSIGVFFAIYDLWLKYYEESKSDRIANFIGVSILFMVFIILVIACLYYSYKRKEFNIMGFITIVGILIFAMALIHIVFIRSPLSGLIQFINANYGHQETVIVDGNVINKYEQRGRGAEFELTIINKEENKEYLFDTKGNEIRKFKLNDTFKIEMKKSCFGLIYLKE